MFVCLHYVFLSFLSPSVGIFSEESHGPHGHAFNYVLRVGGKIVASATPKELLGPLLDSCNHLDDRQDAVLKGKASMEELGMDDDKEDHEGLGDIYDYGCTNVYEALYATVGTVLFLVCGIGVLTGGFIYWRREAMEWRGRMNITERNMRLINEASRPKEERVGLEHNYENENLDEQAEGDFVVVSDRGYGNAPRRNQFYWAARRKADAEAAAANQNRDLPPIPAPSDVLSESMRANVDEEEEDGIDQLGDISGIGTLPSSSSRFPPASGGDYMSMKSGPVERDSDYETGRTDRLYEEIAGRTVAQSSTSSGSNWGLPIIKNPPVRRALYKE